MHVCWENCLDVTQCNFCPSWMVFNLRRFWNRKFSLLCWIAVCYRCLLSEGLKQQELKEVGVNTSTWLFRFSSLVERKVLKLALDFVWVVGSWRLRVSAFYTGIQRFGIQSSSEEVVDGIWQIGLSWNPMRRSMWTFCMEWRLEVFQIFC